MSTPLLENASNIPVGVSCTLDVKGSHPTIIMISMMKSNNIINCN